MRIAYSPCPNDTFVFHAWAHGLIPDAPPLEVTYADIDITNKLAANRSGPEVMKISYAALPWVLEDYTLLPCGGALGRGCGPLVLTRGTGNRPPTADAAGEAVTEAALETLEDATALAALPVPSGGERLTNPAAAGSLSTDGPPDVSLTPAMGSADPAQLSGKRVAVPSERSTAYLLFRLWAAAHVPGGVGEIIVLPFHEIMPAVRDGRIDAGLVIHEARFTYPDYGLQLMTDLGSWWESDTGLPIPLGAIIARRGQDASRIADWIRASVRCAWADPEASSNYVMAHAQEMSQDVAKAHIDLYVNRYTEELGEDGYAAVTALLGRAMAEELVPAFDLALLRQ
ncbi:1,4-dihydroxy-6-naphthoate synthase [Paenibacillus sp. 1P07SE]|uniref:1,4-dihydroxy-6-naphthoate synthase n=1 Tax=Paenibacillus sp. 1P07SE TaxID=3132209 RepID=UPI0039A60594